jgi:hypothetical protein
LDVSTPVLSTLIIEGGRLIIDNKGPIKLEAHHILLRKGAVLQVGTEDEPLENEVEIILHGKKTDK